MNIQKYINALGKDRERLIFISHPYANNPTENRKQVDKICKYWERQGYVPISPLHMFSYMEGDKDREVIMNICYILILLCPAVAIYGYSEGCRQEHNFAQQHRKRIYTMYSVQKKKEELKDNEVKQLMENVRDIIV